jgi:hypothetical protein
LTPTTDGVVSVNIAENTANDSASNGNTIAAQYQVSFDSTIPGLVITGPAGPLNAPFTATFTFSEAMNGFDQTDITVGNGALSNFITSSSTVHTATITPTIDGTVTIDVPANAAVDNALNGNGQASQFSLLYDVTLPTVQVIGPVGPVNAPFTATVSFNEVMSGFAQADISVTNASLSNFATTDNTVFTLTVTPTNDGPVSVDIPASVATDPAGNNNLTASQYSVLYDFTRPTVATSGLAGPLNSSFVATMTFSEAVSGFTAADIVVANATLSEFSATSGVIYTVKVSPVIDGLVSLDVPLGSGADSATNTNTAAGQFSLTYDVTLPTLLITGPTEVVNSAFTATFTFSEPVSGFAITDIEPIKATLSEFVALSTTVYTLKVTPDVFGLVSLTVAANVVIDTANNANAAVIPFAIGR